jgi:nucleotide-binding universal stress UspA family protein
MEGFEALTMHRFRHLLVGLARTEPDAGLIRYAALLARLGTAVEVRFVHVLPTAPALGDTHDRALDDLRAAVAKHFTGVPEGVRVSHDVLKGPLLDRLLSFAAEQEVELMLLGHGQGHSGQRSLARRLAMKAPCSVWMVPEDAPPRLERILVPVDFSEPAADQMLVATALARLAGAPAVQALHVYFDEARVTYEEAEQVLLGEEEKALEEFLAPLNLKGTRVEPLFRQSSDIPAAILRVADEQQVDVIVLATRGRSRSAAILLGSVTEGVIIDSRRPVLVVKHFGARLSLLQVLLDRSFWRRKGPQFD